MLTQLQSVFASFQKYKVKYLIIGGVATVLYGVPRVTFDLDILIEATVDNVQRLLDALIEAGFGTATLISPEELLKYEITVFNDKIRIDVQTRTPGIDFETAWNRRQVVRYRGQELYVVSLSDLIASKRAAGRPVDLEDVRLLLLEEQSATKEEGMMRKKTIRDVDVRGRKVLVRVDFNVPIEDGKVADDTRIRAALPTIQYLLDHGAAVILMSHLGRPKGKPDPKYSLRPVAEHLATLLGQPVHFCPETVGPQAEAMARALKPGEVMLLENTRFHPGETKNDPEFARQLASLVLPDGLFVNDAFGTAHRAHASVVGVAQYLPAVAGLLMEKELTFLGRLLTSPEHPFVAILGGAKISDKIGVIRSLLERADKLLIGGGMANTFLKAQGYEVGDSLVEEEAVDVARELLETAGDALILPVDAVIADRFAADAARRVVPVDQVPRGWRILDIGPKTVERFEAELQGAKTVFWNGPMGVFEFEPFAEGTFAIARAVANLEDAITVIGGGDSVAAVKKAGVADKITHISTGGGASLKFLEGKELPGIAVLEDK